LNLEVIFIYFFPSVTRSEVDVCNLSPEIGIGRAAIPRFYYKSATNSCETFLYGGVHSNGNNFLTKAECDAKCKK
jgi:Kunitz/Bovine pancreatic trypsin inhibitor domain